ncbi:hypothetical protein COLO4_05361 [Corchorus olitorius]|uniref:Uncharacterized protein n=1 Tax=Corchorus olitorius TaxID=93759 RepID=A0A1R3KR43_9ROSI|nr:hypothetical protein COLO4_05361 [Corchorus olitorius]
MEAKRPTTRKSNKEMRKSNSRQRSGFAEILGGESSG